MGSPMAFGSNSARASAACLACLGFRVLGKALSLTVRVSLSVVQALVCEGRADGLRVQLRQGQRDLHGSTGNHNNDG